jgi:hypothetical protein
MTRIKAAWLLLTRFAQKLPAAASWLSGHLIGHWNWQPPSWLGWLGRQFVQIWRFIASDIKRAAIVLLALISMAGAWLWYKSLPVPHYVKYTVTPPALTEYGDKGISSIKPLMIEFKESAAPLQSIEKNVTTGIELSPKVPGAWYWANDKELLFTPKNDWPVDGSFTVKFGRKGILRQWSAAGRFQL